jgi:hypothetical protein
MYSKSFYRLQLKNIGVELKEKRLVAGKSGKEAVNQEFQSGDMSSLSW